MSVKLKLRLVEAAVLVVALGAGATLALGPSTGQLAPARAPLFGLLAAVAAGLGLTRWRLAQGAAAAAGLRRLQA